MFIYVAGIPGTGKSTIIKGLVENLNNTGNKAESIRGLPILCKLAGGISPEEFRKLSDDVREKYRPEMFRIIYEKDQKDPDTIRILDGHFIYFETNSNSFSIRKVRIEDYKQIKAIFVIDSTPESILKRRTEDIFGRSDRGLNLEHIKKQLELEKNEAIKQATELGMSVNFIKNNGKLNDTIEEINIIVRKILNLPNEIIENRFEKLNYK